MDTLRQCRWRAWRWAPVLTRQGFLLLQKRCSVCPAFSGVRRLFLLLSICSHLTRHTNCALQVRRSHAMHMWHCAPTPGRIHIPILFTICQTTNQPPLHHISPEILQQRTQDSKPTTPVNNDQHKFTTHKQKQMHLQEEQSQAMSIQNCNTCKNNPLCTPTPKPAMAECAGPKPQQLISKTHRHKFTAFMHLTQTTPSCVHPNLQDMQHDPLLKPTQLLRSLTKRSEAKAEVQFAHTDILTYILEGGGWCKWLVEGSVWKLWNLGPNEKVEECSNLETEWQLGFPWLPFFTLQLHPFHLSLSRPSCKSLN